MNEEDFSKFANGLYAAIAASHQLALAAPGGTARTNWEHRGDELRDILAGAHEQREEEFARARKAR